MTFDARLLAQLADLALLASVGHVASLLVGVIDQTGRRDRVFGVLVLFILLCSPVFFDERPHQFAMTMFALATYLVGVSWLELRVAASQLLKNFLRAALVASGCLTAGALAYLALNFPVAPTPAAYGVKLLSRNVALFLILSRGAFFAYRQKHLRGFAAVYVFMLLVSPFVLDFALSICGPLLAIGCWALGLDLRQLRRRLTL